MKKEILDLMLVWFHQEAKHSANYADTDDPTHCVLNGTFDLDDLASKINDTVFQVIVDMEQAK